MFGMKIFLTAARVRYIEAFRVADQAFPRGGAHDPYGPFFV